MQLVRVASLEEEREGYPTKDRSFIADKTAFVDVGKDEISSRQPRREDPYQFASTEWQKIRRRLRPFIKRSIDIAGSTSLLLFFLPALTLISCAIAADGGSVFYASVRVGRGGREFRCLKFRTMVPDAAAQLAELLQADENARAEWERTVKLQCDPRVTSVGRILRKLSLDELPQLANVLLGSMSLVGPRPVPQVELQKYYGVHAQDYVSVRPGLTGPWQVGGRSDASYDRRVALDVAYARNPSIRTDLRTLVQTVSAVLFCKGAR